MPTAVLLQGPRGLGKTSFAETIGQSLLCDHRAADSHPCNRCRPCQLFGSGTHPDHVTLEAEGADNDEREEEQRQSVGGLRRGVPATSRWIRVEQVRALRDFLALRPHLGRAKVVTIRAADRLRTSAANALLKMLEEPPGHVHFTLTTAWPQRLPATVRSRCVRLAFRVPPAEVSLAWLEPLHLVQPALALSHTGFAPLAAREFDKQSSWEWRATFIRRVLSNFNFNVVELADSIRQEELPEVLALLQRWCYDLLSLKSCGRIRYNPDQAGTLEAVAAHLRADALLSLVEQLNLVARSLEHPLNSRLVVEHCLISYRRLLA